MAVNSHKKVRELMKSTKISNMELFTSTMFKKHLEDIATNITKRWNSRRKIIVYVLWETDKSSPVAYTDNSQVVINAGHPMVRCNDRKVLYKKVLGLFAHELGHTLWTDFLASMSYEKAMRGYRWYPKKPSLSTVDMQQNESEFWDFAKANPNNLFLLIKYISNISNIIEDGFIEEQIFRTYPGTLSLGLKTMRDAHWNEMPELIEMIDEEDDFQHHILFTVLQELLAYAKYGEVKCNGVPVTDEHIEILGDLIPVVDEAMQSEPKDRLRCCSEIAIIMFPYLKDFINKYLENVNEEMQQQQQNQQGQQGQQGQGQQGGQGGEGDSPELDQEQSDALADALSKAAQSLTGNTQQAKGNTGACAKVDKSNKKTEQGANRQKTKTQIPAAKTESSDSEEEEETTAKTSNSGDNETEDENNPGNELSNELGEDEADAQGEGDGDESEEGEDEISPSGDGGDENGTLKSGNKEGGKIKYGDGECEDSAGDGTVSINSDYEAQIDENLEKDLEKMFNDMAEEKAVSKLENEKLCELNSFASDINYGNAHRGVAVRVNRINTVNDYMKEMYEQIAPPLLQISKRLVRKYEQIADDARTGGRLDGLLMGRKFNAAAAYRNDGKVFVKNILPQDMQPLSVALLLDESGSMGGPRETAARATAIILQNFCETLGIPIAIYGHTTSGYNVELFSYCEFDSVSKNDKYRLVDIGARNCNRDGAALRFVAEKIARRPEEAKLLILVSDGQPNGNNYSGACAEADLRGIQKEYSKKGICFCAAAIGDDKETIERIYGDAFLNVSDLEQLPQKLIKILSRYLHTI